MSDGPLRLGVLGAGSWILEQAIIPAIAARDDVELVAAASRSSDPAPHWADVAAASYDDVLATSEAVYVPLANDQHLAWVEAAAAAGVHVLCEKPLGRTADEAAGAFDACERAGVLLAEAWMTPFHPVGDVVAGLVADGSIGELLRVDTTFTFPGPDSDNYRWSPEHGGGALLDLGVYVLSPLLALLDDPVLVAADQRRRRGVDATTHAVLRGAGGELGTATCSFETIERQRLEVTGTRGRIAVATPFTPSPSVDHVEVDTGDGPRRVDVPGANDPYAAMLGAFADAVRGRATWPRGRDEVLRTARLVDDVVALAAQV